MEDIYDNPQRYAGIVSCSQEVAEKRCEYYRNLKRNAEKARVCPMCGQSSLVIEFPNAGSHNFLEQVICQNCEFESEITAIFRPLQWFDCGFDLLLYACKCKELFDMPWDVFVAKDTEQLLLNPWD